MRIKFENYGIAIQNKEIIKDINLEVNTGDILWIKGSNGSGKSVLLKHILGLVGKKTAGVKCVDLEMGSLCYLNNAPLFYDTEKVSDIIRYYKWMFKQDVTPYFDVLGLNEPYHKRFGDLSDGTRRKLTILPLFMEGFEVYVLDEILGNLDKETRDLCLHRLKELEFNKKTILFVDHEYMPFNEKKVKVFQCG